MVRPKHLYHGSAIKIIGDKLIPKKAKDVNKENIDNNLKGVYASSNKKQATAMALHSSKGVKEGSLQMQKKKGKISIKNSIVYIGWPKQKYVYLYTLPSTTFKNIPQGSPQWVSSKSVKPEKIEKLLVKNYLHLIRKATKKEIMSK